MKIQSATAEKTNFLDKEELAGFYLKWRERLFNSLARFTEEELTREDAVLSAFTKAMEKPAETFKRIPETERQLFTYLRYQAMGELSHIHRKRDTRRRHEKGAFDLICLKRELEMKGRRQQADGFGRSTLFSLAKEAGVKADNLRAYVECYLNDEPSEKVARRYGITTNNLYAICHRIEKLLKEKGPERYEKLSRGEYVLAA